MRSVSPPFPQFSISYLKKSNIYSILSIKFSVLIFFKRIFTTYQLMILRTSQQR